MAHHIVYHYHTLTPSAPFAYDLIVNQRWRQQHHQRQQQQVCGLLYVCVCVTGAVKQYTMHKNPSERTSRSLPSPSRSLGRRLSCCDVLAEAFRLDPSRLLVFH